MNPAQYILDTGYEAIIAMLVANFLAQLLKFLGDWRRRGEIHIPTLFATGGMPSSHSSTVTALSTPPLMAMATTPCLAGGIGASSMRDAGAITSPIGCHPNQWI